MKKFIVVVVLFSLTVQAQTSNMIGIAVPSAVVVQRMTNVGRSTQVAGQVSQQGGNAHVTLAEKLRKCGWGCWVLAGLAAAQAVAYFAGRDNAQEACSAATEGCPNYTYNNDVLRQDTQSTSTGVTSAGTYYGKTGRYSFNSKPSPTKTLAEIKAQYPRLNNVLNKLAQDGVTLNEDGSLTTPRGTFSPAQLGTAEGLAAAGVTTSDLKAADEIAKSVAQDIQKNKVAHIGPSDEAGRGDGKSPGGAGDYNTDDELRKYLHGMMRQPASKESLAGLSVIRNGEPIGIAQSNIFETITRRYGKLQEQGVVGLPSK